MINLPTSWFLCLGLVFLTGCHAQLSETGPEWGVDSRLVWVDSAKAVDHWLNTTRKNGVTWYREALDVDSDLSHAAARFQQIRSRGGKVVLVYPWKCRREFSPVRGFLEADLEAEFSRARAWAAALGGHVDAWELANEPDLGFVKAMPDQYASWAKASYLGLKSSLPPSVPVLAGAMGLPPGTYLDRIARNGILHYSDGFNFHYYGHPEDFPDLITTLRHRLKTYFQRGWSPRSDPTLWVTECGFRTAMESSGQAPPRHRQRQANELSKIARLAGDLDIGVLIFYSLFEHAPFALFEKKSQTPFPVWQSLAPILRSSPSGPRRVDPQSTPTADPLVLQWLPEEKRTEPVKPSGAYLFRPDRLGNQHSMSGSLRLWNFSGQPREGFLNWELEGAAKATIRGPLADRWLDEFPRRRLWLKIPARGSITVPFHLSAPADQPSRYQFTARFYSDTAPSPANPRLAFSVESPRNLASYHVRKLRGKIPYSFRAAMEKGFSIAPSLKPSSFSYHYIDRKENAVVTSTRGPWLGLNGIRVLPPWHMETPASPHSLSIPWQFLLTHSQTHPNRPPTAVTKVQGLPDNPDGILLLQPDRFFDKGFLARVDLVDSRGRRFTIYDQFGLPYRKNLEAAWLPLRDFHPYGWGRFRPEPLDPREVREIQIRFYMKEPDVPVAFRLSYLTPSHKSVGSVKINERHHHNVEIQPEAPFFNVK